MMTKAILQIRNLSRIHGSGARQVEALSNICLDVHPGELVAVMGPSGSGKSTLLNLAGGLDTPTQGSVEVLGQDIAQQSYEQRAAIRRLHVGYVFQDFNLIPALTVLENVALPLELARIGSRQVTIEAKTALGKVGVLPLAHRFPHEISGGQAQRVAIARALVGHRQLILADEPTGALDSHTSEEVIRVMRHHIDDGAAGLLVTHEPRMAAWADRTVFLRDGVLVDATQVTDPQSLLQSNPAS